MTYKEMRQSIELLQNQVDLQARVTPFICEHVAVLTEWAGQLDFDPPEDVAKALWFLDGCFPKEEVPDGGSEDIHV
jgi:hypothetical protein